MSHHFHSEGVLGRVAFVLVMIGGISWGLIGLFDYNVVSSIFGIGTVTKVIYHLIGISTLYVIFRKYLPGRHEAEHAH